jgi:oligo-1,6-glucosidase
MKLTPNSRLRDIYAHPIGRDIANKLLLQTGKPAWLIYNPLVGGLKLATIQKLAGGRIGSGFFDAILGLLNGEQDVPNPHPAETAPRPGAWWKEAVFYQIYPRSFTPDGLRGIISKLDYLRDLGIDAVWLSPVYDSPNDDNGYDIRDYYKILPEFGNLGDMDALIAGLHERGMKLVMDLVVNHTSDEHPWFQSALRDENSPCRDYYFFRKTGAKPPNNWTSFFGGPAWNYYPEQDTWALHLFSKKQMDLNWECPQLREEIYKMVRWWLEKGVDGFRLDVINYISKPGGLPDGDPFIGGLMGYTGVEHYFYGPKLHEYLRELREKAFKPYNAFSVGETPGVGVQMGRLLTDEYRRELDLIFSFDHLETPGHVRFDEYRYDLPYLKQFYQTHLNADCGHGWNTLFFNNHDNPRMLSKIDPDGEYAEALARLLAVLQLTLRGTPFIYQGDEIGSRNEPFASIEELRDVERLNLYAELVKTMPPDRAFKRVLAGTRDHARAPLRWEEFENQRGTADSVWQFYRKLIALRRSSRALIYGELQFLRPKDKTLLSYTRCLAGECFYECFYIEANLSSTLRRCKPPAGAELLLGNYAGASNLLRPYETRLFKIGVSKRNF